MKNQSSVLIILGALVGMVFAASRNAYAAPGDDCALLTPSQIEKVFGQPFNAPAKAELLPPFGQKYGSQCTYKSQKDGSASVHFFVYVTASPAQAKQWFDMSASANKRSTQAAIGDAAFCTTDKQLHVLKSNVLFWIWIDPRNQKRLEDLATIVASRI